MLVMFRDVRVAKGPALDNCLGSECWAYGDNDGGMRMVCAKTSVSLAIRSDLISQQLPKDVFDFSRRVIRLEAAVCGERKLFARDADGHVAEP